MSAANFIFNLVDFLLNIAGLLLWLSWRSVRFDPFARSTPATLSGTIRRIEPARFRRWHFLAALGGLLLLRAFVYWQIGPSVNWVPRLDFFFVALAFRSNYFDAIFTFSIFSFLQALIVFHFWLLFLALVNRRSGGARPHEKLIQVHLGRIARWPAWLQLIVPIAVIALLWSVCHPLLVYLRVLNPARSVAHIIEQGLLVGASVYLSLKFLVPACLLLHLIASYVYLGSTPFWDFVSLTAKNLLSPLRRLPLRAGKMDFAPLVGILLTVLALHFLPEWIRNAMIRWRLPVWPQ